MPGHCLGSRIECGRGLLDGTRPNALVTSRFERDVECDAAFPFMRNRSLKQKVARFRQVNPEQPIRHHDALEFPDGQIALVTDLCEGQHATVLQLPAPARAPSEAEPTHVLAGTIA